MKYILAILYLSLACVCSFGSEEMATEYRAMISNVVERFQIDEMDYRHFTDESTEIKYQVSALEAQYAHAMVGSVRDEDLLIPVEKPEVGEHGKNADRLEMVRLLLNYELKKQVLIERLKELDEQAAKIKSQRQNQSAICDDVGEFIDRLATARKVELRRLVITEEEPGVKYESLIVEDKDKIEALFSLFSSINFKYKPALSRQVFESSHSAYAHRYNDPLPSSNSIIFRNARLGSELIVDERDFISIKLYDYFKDDKVQTAYKVVCLAKSYSYDHEGDLDLLGKVESILKKGVTWEGTSR